MAEQVTRSNLVGVVRAAVGQASPLVVEILSLFVRQSLLAYLAVTVLAVQVNSSLVLDEGVAAA